LHGHGLIRLTMASMECEPLGLFMIYCTYRCIPMRHSCMAVRGLTRSSADADKPARRVYTGYGFLLVFCRNFVPNTHHFWDIRLQ